MMEYADIVILGGGASGLAAAITAKRLTPEAKVVILESSDRVGKKILETGNGRCNLSNLTVSPEDYNAPGFVEPVISRYPFEEVAQFFLSLGLTMEDDGQGRVFPKTYTATSVLDVLRLACREQGIEIRCNVDVDEIAAEVWDEEDEEDDLGDSIAFRDEPRIVIRIDKQILFARRIILATGGLMNEKTRKLYTDLFGPDAVTELRPGLVPLETETEFIKGLSGIRVKCAGTLFDLSNDETRVLFSGEGEILFRDYGISGILAMDFSRYLRGEGEYVCFLNLIPGLSYNELELMLERRLEFFPGRTAREFLVGLFQSRVADAVLKMAGISPEAPFTSEDVQDLLRALKSFRIPIKRTALRQKPQIICGGISRDLVDPETLEALKVNGVYVVGETLDVDGRCGGFNLHWAWASGIAAGTAAAEALKQVLLTEEAEGAGADTGAGASAGADADAELDDAEAAAEALATLDSEPAEGADGAATGEPDEFGDVDAEYDGPESELFEGLEVEPELEPVLDAEPWMGFDDESSPAVVSESALDIPPAEVDVPENLDLDDLDLLEEPGELEEPDEPEEPEGPESLLDQLAWGIPIRSSFEQKDKDASGEIAQVTASQTDLTPDGLDEPVMDTAEMDAYASGMPTMDASIVDAALAILSSEASIEEADLGTLSSETFIPTI